MSQVRDRKLEALQVKLRADRGKPLTGRKAIARTSMGMEIVEGRSTLQTRRKL
jgi:hypothetical protein